MQRFQIRLKQFLISVFMLALTGLCVQADANANPDFTGYRMQKVVSTFNQQNLQRSVANQKQSVITNTTNNQKSASIISVGKLPLFLLALAVIGLTILIFIPGRYIRKPLNIGEEDVTYTTEKDAEVSVDAADDYMASLEAEDEIEQQLDAEEELDSIDMNFQRKIVSRESKHNNRISSRRKK